MYSIPPAICTPLPCHFASCLSHPALQIHMGLSQACSDSALLRMGSFVPRKSSTFMHDAAEAECVLEGRDQWHTHGKRVESEHMDALKSHFLSTRSLIILSKISSLRGSALRILSFRVSPQAQIQKVTPQRRRSGQNVVSKPDGNPISFTGQWYMPCSKACRRMCSGILYSMQRHCLRPHGIA
jgi:hypothetical protein